jgi:hypothetical protein
MINDYDEQVNSVSVNKSSEYHHIMSRFGPSLTNIRDFIHDLEKCISIGYIDITHKRTLSMTSKGKSATMGLSENLVELLSVVTCPLMSKYLKSVSNKLSKMVSLSKKEFCSSFENHMCSDFYGLKGGGLVYREFLWVSSCDDQSMMELDAVLGLKLSRSGSSDHLIYCRLMYQTVRICSSVSFKHIRSGLKCNENHDYLMSLHGARTTVNNHHRLDEIIEESFISDVNSHLSNWISILSFTLLSPELSLISTVVNHLLWVFTKDPLINCELFLSVILGYNFYYREDTMCRSSTMFLRVMYKEGLLILLFFILLGIASSWYILTSRYKSGFFQKYLTIQMDRWSCEKRVLVLVILMYVSIHSLIMILGGSSLIDSCDLIHNGELHTFNWVNK